MATDAAIQRPMRREGPANLGSIEGFASRYPRQQQNADATRLVALAAPLGIERDAADVTRG